MRVILVEDNWREAKAVEKDLAAALRCNTSTIRTELEFRDRLEEIERNPPDLFVVDVSLRWTAPGPDFRPEPDDVRAGGRGRAGFRCVQRLQQRLATRGVPIVLYSHFSRFHFEDELKDLSPSVIYVKKTSDPESLVQAIRALLETVGR